MKMPYDDPDPTDPQMLIGVVLPGDTESVREMAYVFAEEFARLGHGEEDIRGLFRDPFYAGAYGAQQTLGENAIGEIVAECVAVWGKKAGRSR